MASSKARKVGDAARAKLADALGVTMVMAIDRLANATPVDTQHCSTNWIGSVGAPFTGVAGSREAPSRREQLAGRARVRAYSAADIKARRALYIRNNVFYLKFLDEDGTSQQAPAGFVRRALQGKGGNVTRHIPKGSRAAARKMLSRISRTAYKRSKGL